MDIQSKIQASNSEIELKKFIENNLTEREFPSEPVIFETFKISDDLLRYKAFLAEQTKELKKEAEDKIKVMMDMEKTKQ